MSFEPFGKVGIIWNNPTIVENYSLDFDLSYLAVDSMPSSIKWITVLIRRGFVAKVPRVFLRTIWSVFHTRRSRKHGATGAMHHIACDDIVQIGVEVAVRDLRANDVVKEFYISDFVISLQNEQDMCMRKPTFLKFNRVDICDWFSEYVFIAKIGKKFLQFEIEDPCDDVRTIRCRKAWGKICHNLFPSRVASESDEEVGSTVMTTDSHSILVKPFHLSWTAGDRRW
jgi:hypothetical protein